MKKTKFIAEIDREVLLALRYYCKLRDMKINEVLEKLSKEFIEKQNKSEQVKK